MTRSQENWYALWSFFPRVWLYVRFTPHMFTNRNFWKNSVQSASKPKCWSIRNRHFLIADKSYGHRYSRPSDTNSYHQWIIIKCFDFSYRLTSRTTCVLEPHILKTPASLNSISRRYSATQSDRLDTERYCGPVASLPVPYSPLSRNARGVTLSVIPFSV